MELKDILSDDVSHDEAKDAVKEHIRSVVDSFVTEEKDGCEKEDEDGEDEESEEDGEDEESEEDDEDDRKMDESLNEAMKVTAHTPSGRSQEIDINRMSDLRQYAQTGKYDYFVVTDKQGNETEYAVDPSGNLTEM